MAISRVGFPRALRALYDQLDLLNKYKVADQAVNNSAVLVDDATLQFPMLANQKYSFEAMIFFDTLAAADFKFRHTGPAAPTLVRVASRIIDPSALTAEILNVETAFSGSDVAVAAAAGTTGGWIFLNGIIHNGANAGDFKFRWAQNTQTVGDTIVRAGSFIRAMRLS